MDVDFLNSTIDASLFPPGCSLLVRLHCPWLSRQLLLLEQIFTQCLPHTSHVHHLRFNREYTPESGQQDSVLWLRFLRPFNAVQIPDVTDDQLLLTIRG